MYITFQALILQHAYAWLGMGSDHEGDLDSGSLYMYMSLLVVQLACQLANQLLDIIIQLKLIFNTQIKILLNESPLPQQKKHNNYYYHNDYSI